MKEPNLTPKWLCNGTTYLLAKSNETENPKTYRPLHAYQPPISYLLQFQLKEPIYTWKNKAFFLTNKKGVAEDHTDVKINCL